MRKHCQPGLTMLLPLCRSPTSLTSGLSDGSSKPQRFLNKLSNITLPMPYFTRMFHVRRYFQPVCGILMAKLAKEAGKRAFVCKKPDASCLYSVMTCTHPCS